MNRKMDSIKYIRQTKDYKALLSKLEVTMAEERVDESEPAPDGDTHLHQINQPVIVVWDVRTTSS